MTAQHLAIQLEPGTSAVHRPATSDEERPRAPGGSRGTAGLLPSLLLVSSLALPATAAAYQERLILAVEAGKCTLRLEADDEARSLRLRVVPGGGSCRVAREAVQLLLKEAFSRTEPPRLEGVYSSLSIGRLIDFPWLSAYLASAASADERWDRRRGKPVAMGMNAYVAMLLSRKEVTTQLESPIRGSGYRVPSATVEKVLVGGFRDVPQHEGQASPGKVPFDAMVWFRLEKD